MHTLFFEKNECMCVVVKSMCWTPFVALSTAGRLAHRCGRSGIGLDHAINIFSPHVFISVRGRLGTDPDIPYIGTTD